MMPVDKNISDAMDLALDEILSLTDEQLLAMGNEEHTISIFDFIQEVEEMLEKSLC